MEFRFVTILRWARKVLVLLPFPNWTDVEAVRHWVIRALGIADELAEKTETKVDDFLVAAMRKVVSSTEIWTAFYTLIVDLLADEEAGMPVAQGNTKVAVVAEKAGISLSTFRELINLILGFIAWWRDQGLFSQDEGV